MSETDLVSTEAPLESAGVPARKRGGLTGMVLAELRQLAGELNIPDTSGMRKGELIAAIRTQQGASSPVASDAPAAQPAAEWSAVGGPDDTAPVVGAAVNGGDGTPATTNGAGPTTEAGLLTTRRRRTASRPAGAPVGARVESQPVQNGSAAETASGVPSADPAPAAAGGIAPADPASAAAGGVPSADPALAAAAEGTLPIEPPPVAAGASPPPAEPAPPAVSVRAESAPDTRTASAVENMAVGSAPVTEGAQSPGTDTETTGDGGSRRNRQGRSRGRGDHSDVTPSEEGAAAETDERGQRGDGRRGRGEDRDGRGNDRSRGERPENRNDNRTDRGPAPRGDRVDDDSDDDVDGRGRRGRRFRDRRRGRDRERPVAGGTAQGGQNNNTDTEVREGDVVLPVAGIIDVLDNYAFVRTTGYLSGPTDVYVSLSLVRRYGLRRGDAITGAVREQREGEQSRQKFNPLVRVDSINGQDPEASRNRPEFTKLTPLYPNERLRLETESHKLTTRVIDLVMPIGKGQRALIVSPPKAGKTMIMQAIANAITTNNPECHLMVVLVDERPEEVTDMTRSVKGEVIASTFDRPPGDHTTVAELAIERAKRLVEMGHDVVVLLDSITRLGRAYNLAAPASGRILSGGVDSTALYPPKRFLGAARNIEDGGSLTIFATALVETGSTMDTVIFEEFKGTGNAELKLDRRIADKRVFPAIDVDASGTRKEELLLSPDELAVTVKLRRVLSALDDQQAIDLLLTQLRKSRTNIEFLMQVAKSTPGSDD